MSFSTPIMVILALAPGAERARSEEKSHWAFQPLQKVAVPPDPSGWSNNPVDRFIAAKWRAQQLVPAPAADKRTLLRRVTFDLIGLPPTPEETSAFLADRSPDAFALVVDRLLASPHYGERWGRHWMDVARYADTAGDNADYPIPEIYLYRDYIIDSFNRDKPFDQFVHEQLAGDILAQKGPQERRAEQVAATGFLALSRRYATAPYELWHLTLEDTIDTTGQAFLGLTLRCARCHDHKFDPITREDYYALYGIFASTQFPWAGAEELASMGRPREHFVPLVPQGQVAQYLAAHQRKIALLQERLKQVGNDRLKDVRTEMTLLQRPGLPSGVPGAYAVQEGKPVDQYIHIRGDVNHHGPIVPRGAPKFLLGDQPLHIPPGSSGRLQLAEWITRPDNPLTARVMVNRIWQHHFGKGIVGTPSNFGIRGEPPTHPELLDWLAARFIESGWSIKALHRLIVLSRTYQLGSADREENLARDPGNRWYWRFDRNRLDAESIRDAMLLVSGRLKRHRPGRHPFPAIEKWGWTQHNPFKDVYPAYERSVYLMTQRFQRHPYLALFDGPDTNTTTGRRSTSTVPLQALYLMNDPFVREQAEGFARRLIGGAGDCRKRVDLAYQWAFARLAQPGEQESGVRYVEEYARKLAEMGLKSEQQELESWTSYARVLLCANEFVYLD